MQEDAPSTLYVVLADEVTSGQIAVPLDAFAEFAMRMELDLEVLKQRFASFAAAKATLVRRQSL